MPRSESGINYHRCGSGPPLLLVHGIGHHWQGWAPQIALLENSYELIVPDLPGFGRSDVLPAGIEPTIPALAEALVAFLGDLEVERPHCAGNSLGGAIVLELARLGAVRSAHAISPAGFWNEWEHRYSSANLALTAGLPAPAKRAVYRAVGTAAGRAALMGGTFARPWRMPAPEARSMLADFWNSPGWDDTLAATGDYAFERGEELTGCELTVSWGSRDYLLLYRPQSRRARERLPQANHVTLPGLGHTPFYDDPELVAETIRAGAQDQVAT